MKKNLTYDLPDDGHSFLIDFDNNSEARYEATIREADAKTGDGLVVSATREACLAFARTFAQLSERGGHVHLGYSDEEPQGPGIRIVVNSSGRFED